MNCESGDQKGKSAPSVCSIRCASGELKALIHKKLLPEASVAANANIWPSGESAMCSNGCQFRCSVTPSGKPSESLTVFKGRAFGRNCNQITRTRPSRPNTPASKSTEERHDREATGEGRGVTTSFGAPVGRDQWNSGTYDPDGSSIRTTGVCAHSL